MNEKTLDATIRHAVRAQPIRFDAEQWKAGHPEEVRLVESWKTDRAEAVQRQRHNGPPAELVEPTLAHRGPGVESNTTHTYRRIILLRLGLGMAAAILLFVGLKSVFWGPSGSAHRGVVLAAVVEHMRTAHTVTCKTSVYAEGRLVATAEQMFKEGYLCRTATSDGHIYIQDITRGRTLALNPEKRTATFLDTLPSHYDFYKLITQFRVGTETSLGAEEINGREAIGFAIHDGAGDASIWVDAQTHLPLQMRHEDTDRNGKKLRIITMDFVLDSPLDDSLFSLELPEGYQEGDVESKAIDRARQLALYVQSANAAKRIVKACIRFADEHEVEWPGSLDFLKDYGIDAQALVNPRRPDLALGWSYLRPAAGKDELGDPANTVLIYEVFEEWNEGVNVGFADGSVQFIKGPDRLRQLLGESRNARPSF